MAKSMSFKLEFVAPLPQIAIMCFTYNAVEFYGPKAPRYKEVDLYFQNSQFLSILKNIWVVSGLKRCTVVQNTVKLKLNG